MAAHASLTGADLHESKGVASASANTVQVATGTGTAAWQTITSSSINTSSIKNVNKYKMTVQMADVSTADFILVPVTAAATLNSCRLVLNNAITLADSTITFTNSTGPASLGTLTVAFTGSAEGTGFTFTPTVNHSFSTNTYLKIATDGASSTAAKATLFLEWTLN